MACLRTSNGHVLLLDPRNRVRPLLRSDAARMSFTLQVSCDTGSARQALQLGASPAVMLLAVDAGGEGEALDAVRTLRFGSRTRATRIVALLGEGLSLDEEGLLRERVDACWRLSSLTPSLLDGILESELRSVSRLQESVPSATAGINGAGEGMDLDHVLRELSSLVDDNRDSLHWVRDVIDRLRDTDRAHGLETIPVELHTSVDSALAQLRGELGGGIRVVREYADICSVACHVGLLEQAFVHLIRNAAQALDGEGEIRILTAERNGHAVVSVRDTGEGIAEDVLPHIFSPFFTTRTRGQGTGLGLPLSYGIIARHGGHMEVESHHGDYAEFRVHLPVTGVLDSERVVH